MDIGVTGHRPDKLCNEWDGIGPCSDWVSNHLQAKIYLLNPERLITGMALGVDTIFARLAIFNNIPFTAAIPFKDQELKWAPKQKNEYHQIISHPLCTIVYVCDPGYAVWKMYKRNQWIVENCDLLISVWDGSAGGTSNCVEWATKKKTEMINIDLKSYQIKNHEENISGAHYPDLRVPERPKL